jgi:hypothetical protein
VNPPAARSPRNFLSRLADRAAGREPVVEARVPSLFEPASPHDVQPTDVATPIEASEIHHARHADNASRVSSEPISPRFTRQRDDGQPTARDAASSLLPTPLLIARETHTVPAPASSRTGDPSPSIDARSPEPVGDMPPASRRTEATAALTPQPNVLRATRAAEDGPHETPRPQTNVTAAATEPGLPASVLAAKRIHVDAPATPRRAPESPQRIERASPAESVVRISIGRVEVRATQSASAPSSPRGAPRRAMSLDEYLDKSRRAR